MTADCGCGKGDACQDDDYLRAVSLRDEWFVDAEGYQHNRMVDPDDLAVFCDHDNETWPCSGVPVRTADTDTRQSAMTADSGKDEIHD